MLIILFAIHGLYEPLFNGLVYVKWRGWQTFAQSPFYFIVTVASGAAFLLFLSLVGVVLVMAARAKSPDGSPRYRRDHTLYNNRIVRPLNPDSMGDP